MGTVTILKSRHIEDQRECLRISDLKETEHSEMWQML
jgi:hypothetical protein